MQCFHSNITKVKDLKSTSSKTTLVHSESVTTWLLKTLIFAALTWRVEILRLSVTSVGEERGELKCTTLQMKGIVIIPNTYEYLKLMNKSIIENVLNPRCDVWKLDQNSETRKIDEEKLSEMQLWTWSQTTFKQRTKKELPGGNKGAEEDEDMKLMNMNESLVLFPIRPFCLYTHLLCLSDHQRRDAATWLHSFILTRCSRRQVLIFLILVRASMVLMRI